MLQKTTDVQTSAYVFDGRTHRHSNENGMRQSMKSTASSVCILAYSRSAALCVEGLQLSSASLSSFLACRHMALQSAAEPQWMNEPVMCFLLPVTPCGFIFDVLSVDAAGFLNVGFVVVPVLPMYCFVLPSAVPDLLLRGGPCAPSLPRPGGVGDRSTEVEEINASDSHGGRRRERLRQQRRARRQETRRLKRAPSHSAGIESRDDAGSCNEKQAAGGTVENTDARKVEKRQRSVSAIKRTPEYQSYLVCLAQGLTDCVPEPDPTDLLTTKREWELSIQNWRRRLSDIQSALWTLSATPQSSAEGEARAWTASSTDRRRSRKSRGRGRPRQSAPRGATH